MRWPAATLAVFSARAGHGLRLAVCGLLAAAQLLVFSHAATVGHRTCALHGESVHAQPAHALSAVGWLEGRALPASSDDEAHEHEHCLCLGQTRERVLLSSTAELPSRSLIAAHDLAVVTVREPIAVALWSLAPKNSPPA